MDRETFDTALDALMDRAVILLAEPLRDVLLVADSRARERPDTDEIAFRACEDHVLLADKAKARKQLLKRHTRKNGGAGDAYVWALVKLDMALDEVMSLALRRLAKLRGSMLTEEEKEAAL